MNGRRRQDPLSARVPEPVTAAGIRTPSVARNSAAKLVADAAVLLSGLLMGVITARWLGPGGKGLLSAVLFAGALAAQSATLGLGDSAILLVGRRRVSVIDASRASVIPVTIAVSIVSILFLLFWKLQFPIQWETYRTELFAGTLFIPLGSAFYISASLLNAQERFGVTSAVTGAVAVLTPVFFLIFSVFSPASVLLGLCAGLTSLALGLAFLLTDILRSRFTGARSSVFLGEGLRIGIPLQASHLLVSMSQRLDQVIVFSLAGPVAGGRYSVALTMGQLIVYIPFALSSASFPRISQLHDQDVAGFVARLFRISAASVLLGLPLLFAAIAIGTEMLFGAPYAPSIIPALILALGGSLWVSQWLVTRALAARGKSGPLLKSFLYSLVMMLVLDRLLVPEWGLLGAALASASASAFGFVYAIRSLLAFFESDISLKDLLPRRADFGAILKSPSTVQTR